ncbi:AprI/Inh family metalloprotease inhibitor [Bartonella sp. CB189]|uniref:AprI/Inh family metalloprotease inhibitor n=1 Tax=Bartonella sp. CB189 TaxID=3112254 RepID=UPI002F96326B
MIFSKISLFVAIPTITILSGCLSTHLKNNNQNNTPEVFYPVQQTLTIDMPNSAVPYSSKAEITDTPGHKKEYSRSDAVMANLELPGNAVELFPASIAGVWNLSVGGQVCRIATPQTKFGRGYRAAPLRCPGVVSRVKSWETKGKKLYFYDNLGRIVVSLYSSDFSHFEGYTLDNYPVVLSR